MSPGRRKSHNRDDKLEYDPSHEIKATTRTRRFSGQVLGHRVHKNRRHFSCVCGTSMEPRQGYSPGKRAGKVDHPA